MILINYMLYSLHISSVGLFNLIFINYLYYRLISDMSLMSPINLIFFVSGIKPEMY